MKGLSVLLVLAVAVGFGLTGCSDTTDPIVAPADQPEAISLAKGPVVHSASGSGHMYLDNVLPYDPLEEKEKERTFRSLSFTACETAEGEYSGMLNMGLNKMPKEDGGPNLYFRGDVIFLKVDNNMATVGFRVDNATNPAMVGWVGVIVFEDNGEGGNAPLPDMNSGFLWPPNETSYNTVISWSPQQVADFIGSLYGVPPLVKVDRGNIQIR